MNKYDYGKRLKQLCDRECDLRREENYLTKRIHEYNNNFKVVVSRIEKQRRKLIKFSERVEKLSKKNTKLRTLNDKMKNQLRQHQQWLDHLGQERSISLQQQKQEEERVWQERLNLHCFQSYTKTFFNMRKLPKLIQGLTVSEQENACQLLPFKIDPQQYTHKEVMDIMWEKLITQSGSFENHWQYLIFGNCFIDNETHLKTAVNVDAEIQ